MTASKITYQNPFDNTNYVHERMLYLAKQLPVGDHLVIYNVYGGEEDYEIEVPTLFGYRKKMQHIEYYDRIELRVYREHPINGRAWVAIMLTFELINDKMEYLDYDWFNNAINEGYRSLLSK